MKINFSIIFLSLLLVSCSKDNEIDPKQPEQQDCNFINFKYYDGDRDTLGILSNNYILIGTDTSTNDRVIKNLIASKSYLDQNYNYTAHSSSSYQFKEIPLKLSSPRNCEQIGSVISDLNKNPVVSYAHFTMQTKDCRDMVWQPIGNLCVNSYSSIFYVKVFDETDLTDLKNMISETNTELKEQNGFMKKWFSLIATKESKGDALKMANYFYESGLFEYCEPEIVKYAVE